MNLPKVIRGLPGEKRISDKKLAKLVDLPLHKMRGIIRECIDDGSIAPTEYMTAHAFFGKSAYYIDESAMLMVVSRVNTPAALAAVAHVNQVVLERHPNILEEFFGDVRKAKVVDGVLVYVDDGKPVE